MKQRQIAVIFPHSITANRATYHPCTSKLEFHCQVILTKYTSCQGYCTFLKSSEALVLNFTLLVFAFLIIAFKFEANMKQHNRKETRTKRIQIKS